MALNPVKHKNFQRLATGRLEDLQKRFRLLSNLASSNYEFSRTEMEELFKSIERCTKWAREDFEKRLLRLEQNK